MIPGTGLPHRQCGAVAANAIGSGRKVGAVFAGGRGAVMASRANRCRCIGAVVGLCTQPSGRTDVTALAIAGHRSVYGGCRFSGSSIGGCQVTGFALGRDGKIGMHSPWVPSCIPPLVAGVAIGCGSEHGVGHMVGRLSMSRRMTAVMAGTATVGNCHLRVVPLRGLPQRSDHIDGRCVAGVAVGRARRRNVQCRFSSGNGPVVASGASTRYRDALIVFPGRRAPSRRLR